MTLHELLDRVWKDLRVHNGKSIGLFSVNVMLGHDSKHLTDKPKWETISTVVTLVINGTDIYGGTTFENVWSNYLQVTKQSGNQPEKEVEV